MGALQTLRGRILAASLVLALLIGIAFVVLILAVRDTRDAARVAEQSERVAAAANLLERLLLDLESGQRAYVITGRRSFLEPWNAALRRYPRAAEELRALVVDPAQRRRVDQIRSELDSYVENWSQRVVDAVVVDRADAAWLVATEEGRRRVDRLRQQFDARARKAGLRDRDSRSRRGAVPTAGRARPRRGPARRSRAGGRAARADSAARGRRDGEPIARRKAAPLGALAYLVQPFSLTDLAAAVRAAAPT